MDGGAGEPRDERGVGVGEAASAVGERPRNGERAERTGGAAAAGAAMTRASSMVLSTSSFTRACAKVRAKSRAKGPGLG